MTTMFLDERAGFERELDAWYGAYPTDMGAVERELHEFSAAHPDWSPCRKKAFGYGLIASRCPVKIFRTMPFFFELDTGKERTNLGEGGVGGWMKRETLGTALAAEAAAWWGPCAEKGLSQGWLILDDNHHSIGNDAVFTHGIDGLAGRARRRLGTAATKEERDFLEAMTAGLDALLTVAGRFAAEAGRMAAVETDTAVKRRLALVAATARRVPAEPPNGFHEGLCTILFMREVVQALEGNGNSVLAHLDRILGPLYERDVAAGRLTPDEARDLLGRFLAFSDAKFAVHRLPPHHVGTNTTVVIGGCDAGGRPVWNDITRMTVEVHRELRLVDPKVNARISRDHPREYARLLAGTVAAGGNALSIFNDETIVAANVRAGKRLEDARLYVGGGCQENLLENTEVNSRATIYLNAAAALLMGILPEDWSFFTDREGIVPAPLRDAPSFEAAYEAFLANLRALVAAHVARRNRTEREGPRYNPCPLHSSTIADCLDRALDMTAGGARYSPGSVSLAGIGTVTDSLFAIREAVYRRRLADWDRLAAALAGNFAGEEVLRRRLAALPKFGQEDEEIRAFSARVFADAAAAGSGLPNTRGGRYEASLFSFRSFAGLGARTGATPDGRRTGEHLSPGMSPSTLALGARCGVGQVLAALEPLDLTLNPVVAVLDLKLPLSREGCRAETIVPVIERFLAAGGSVLQINCVDRRALLDARAHPERHPDLVVRVSGYSSPFTILAPEIQDEIIARTEAGADLPA